MGQIEDKWIYLRDPVNDESDAAAEPRTSSFDGEALFLASGETDLIPCATKIKYPWRERRDTRLGFRLLIVKGEPPVRARSIRRAIHHRRVCDLVSILHHHRGQKSHAIWLKSSAGSPALGVYFMAVTPFARPAKSRWRYVCVFYSLPRPWTSALRGPSCVPAATSSIQWQCPFTASTAPPPNSSLSIGTRSMMRSLIFASLLSPAIASS